MENKDNINYIKTNQIYLFFIVIPSIIIFPKIIQLLFNTDSIFTGAIGGGLGGVLGVIYIKLYKDKLKNQKIYLTIAYLVVLFSLVIVVNIFFHPVYMREIKPINYTNSNSTYFDEKYHYIINYPDGWIMKKDKSNPPKVFFTSNLVSNNDFYSNYNIIVTPLNQKFTVQQLLEYNKKVLDNSVKLKEFNYNIISNTNVSFLEGDAIETIATLNVNDIPITQIQINFLYKNNLYTVTYTTSEDDFNKSLPDFINSIRTLR